MWLCLYVTDLLGLLNRASDQQRVYEAMDNEEFYSLARIQIPSPSDLIPGGVIDAPLCMMYREARV